MVDADCHRGSVPILKATCAAVLAWTAAQAFAIVVGQTPPARVQSRIALLVDTSEGTTGSMTQIRAGLRAFVDELPPEDELVVVTTGRRLAVRVQPTIDRKKARDSVGGLTTDAGPTPLMDAMLEVDERFMRKPADRRAVFVIVTGDGSESSRTNPDTFNQWLAALRSRGASAHALVIKNGNGMPEVVARATVQATSGLFQTISPGTSIAEAMQKIALKISGALPH